MTEKEMFLNSYDREFETTVKTLRAYPTDKFDFKPHEKSRSARELVWNFVHEERMILGGGLAGEIIFTTDTAPESMDAMIAEYEKLHRDTTEKIRELEDAEFNVPITMHTGSDKTIDMRRGDAFWLALSDSIHHRGQLSVYIRLAGGKVPSIYGPSADDPGQ